MSLEAKDRKYPSLTCVATITDINEKGELLIHFDGWSNEYNYWCEPDSTDIHPPMWCGKHHRELQPPNSETEPILFISFFTPSYVLCVHSLMTFLSIILKTFLQYSQLLFGLACSIHVHCIYIFFFMFTLLRYGN